jgi:hypothetical protein
MRWLALLVSMTILAGCSEMKVITSAALRELRADAIAVAPAEETTLVQADKAKEPSILMAKADWRPADWRYGSSKKSVRKGLWETN